MFSWRRKAPRERRRRKHLVGSVGMLPQEIFKIEYSETPFPAFLEPRKQFPRQCWRSLKFSVKSKLLNENGQLVRGRGRENGNNRIFIGLSLFCYPLVSMFTRCLSKKNI